MEDGIGNANAGAPARVAQFTTVKRKKFRFGARKRENPWKHRWSIFRCREPSSANVKIKIEEAKPRLAALEEAAKLELGAAFGLNKILIRRPSPRRNLYVRTKAIELDPGLGDRCRETVALRRSESAPAHPCYRGRNARRCLYLKRKEAKKGL
jgi:hypothetical protein